MGRPRKDQKYRTPTFAANRWRIRVGYHYSANDIRVETDHKWQHPGGSTDTCPPQIIAAAVALQHRWAWIVGNWDELWVFANAAGIPCGPELPVCVTDEQLAQGRATVAENKGQIQRRVEVKAAHSAATLGVERLAGVLASITSGDKGPADNWDADRLAMLEELRPFLKRRAVRAVTIEQAIDEYAADEVKRVPLKVGKNIKANTFNATHKRVLHGFGLSTARGHKCPRPKMREDFPKEIDVSKPLADLDEKGIKALARYWQSLPAPNSPREGSKHIRSRTAKNYVNAVRAFLNWCANQSDYGWDWPKGAADHLTVENSETKAMKYDPALIKKVLAKGSDRLKLYALWGLLQGYGPADISDTRLDETFAEGKHRYVKRERSKEEGGARRKRQGKLKLLIKHWIAPDQWKIVEALHVKGNPLGLLLLNERGLPLSRAEVDKTAVVGVSRAWSEAAKRAGVKLPFKQLRKMGRNGIKSVSGSLEVAEIWSGHSQAIGDHYDDGVFEPVIRGQKKWAEQLRRDGIL